MAIYTSNSNRVTGLSGIDTESMIDKLMKAESAQYERLQREETSISWKQEAYRQLIESLQTFNDKWFGIDKTTNIGYNTAWDNFTTSVLDQSGQVSNAITINGSSESGKYDIEVIDVAQTESLTGKATVENKITTGATADEIVNSLNSLTTGTTPGELSFEFDLDGTTKTITINADEVASATGTTNADKLTNALNDKLKTAFGTSDGTPTGTQKVSVTKNATGHISFEAGAGNSLKISEGTPIKTGTTSVQTNALDPAKEGEYTLTIESNGQQYTVTTQFKKDETPDQRIEKIIESFKTAKDSTGKEVDISKDIDMSITADGNNLVFTNKSVDEQYTIVNSQLDNAGTIETFASNETIKTERNLGYLGLDGARSTSITGSTGLDQAFGKTYTDYFEANKNVDGVLILNFGGKDVNLEEGETIDSLINKINASDVGFELGFNQITGRFKMTSNTSGINGSVALDSTAQAEEITFLNDFLGINLTDKTLNDNYVKGQDAKFKIDGIETTRPTNEINMNGLEFTINRPTTGAVTISAETNTDDSLAMVKDFVKDYNKLISDLEAQINQPREKSGNYDYYDPLLDSEKEAMTEDQIKNWEEKAKKGLLHRDETLTGILSDLRGLVYEPVDIGGGKTISLYEIGITTSSNYNSNKLEVDDAKLKKALEEHGDDITKLFTTANDGIAAKINKVLEDSIGSKGSLREIAGIKDTASVADNKLTDQIKEILRLQNEERKKLYDKEMGYFDSFSRMEAMMNRQNSQMSMLMGILGQQ